MAEYIFIVVEPLGRYDSQDYVVEDASLNGVNAHHLISFDHVVVE